MQEQRLCCKNYEPKVHPWGEQSAQTRSRPIIPSHEVSGLVEAVGEGVTAFQVGDEVYGLPRFDHDGVWAEYAIVTPDWIARRPQSVSHEESAALALSAHTAWQARSE